MSIEELMRLCESLPGVTSDYPFGPQPKCYRVGGRIFADIYPIGVPGALTLLLEGQNLPREAVEPMALLFCTPGDADFWRGQYPKAVLRPYHSPKAQWAYCNTVLLNRGVPDDVLRDMVGNAYKVVLAKLPQKVQAEIAKTNGKNTN